MVSPYSPSSFMCFVQNLERHADKTTNEISLRAGATHDYFGHGTVCKGGVAPAQHGVLPAAKSSLLSCATPSPSGSCSSAKVNTRANFVWKYDQRVPDRDVPESYIR